MGLLNNLVSRLRVSSPTKDKKQFAERLAKAIKDETEYNRKNVIKQIK